MLPSGHRMRRRDEFTLTVRRGRRAGRTHIVVHLLRRDDLPEGLPAAERAPRAGFVVGRTVGNAVVRNKVRRRLRHLVAQHLDRLPPGSLLVVRANPAAATAGHKELAADLESALDRLLRRRA
ncbi:MULTISPECIES: ribonuclease P protein component [Thermomonospora]|uniref:Ribonuclease P protein component n=1 Tax=Thermomonospora curvata (strain ATCC 19995 / DSM 43183 / JCM 3096 / KCTC 9072 / NBRC 15933 / NCIMB 10081 / Henssen B9) TaxID=471852 RepID=D1A969_THECD|nr:MULTISPECIES: ribonuclease P protein component [Thermomonospora]ACZ00499.1 ribonuclease P protein component [Thermomonospora curvata DSM 43183]PKK11874.1 MAG: ribonuclease P protein component [Thermomonospora sp. CIF 1]